MWWSSIDRIRLHGGRSSWWISRESSGESGWSRTTRRTGHFFSSIRRASLVYDATNAVAVSRLKVHRDAAHRLGLTLVEKPVRTEDEARSAISGVRKGEVDGIYSPRLLSLNIPGFIFDIAPKRAIPTMFDDVFYVERAGLASYSANNYVLGRQAARLVDKILKGPRPGDVPVEQPTKFELVINLKAAKALGITIPQSILGRADRVID